MVGTDKVVEKLKGKKPVIPQEQRLYMVNSLKGVYKAFLGYESMDFTQIIKEIAPDVILLGPDQSPSDERLGNMLVKAGLDVKICR